MQKIFNSQYGRDVMTIMPGEYYISTEKELISTLLGSCIAVCLYENKAGIGGMNHFLLPEYSGKSGDLYSSARYGVSAMEILIMKMQLKGADRDRIQAKVFGGGNVLSLSQSPDRVGERNIRFIHDYLKTESIKIVSEDTGDYFSRKVLFNTEDFSVRLSKVPVDSTVVHSEEDYFKRITRMQEKTEIVYF
ncbi:MAG: hypothetical protein JXR86_20195 [Spirochaetales bacterium]|nr:hypothetical protein [Spirochaetales bacterium]